MAFYTPLNDAGTTLSSPHSIGSGTLVVTSGAVFGSPSPSAPVRVTVRRDPDDGTVTIFSVTGITGNTLTVTPIESTSDAVYASGSTCDALVTAGAISDLNTQVTTNTSAIATNTAAITTKAADNAVVHLTGNETVAGIKTFGSQIVGSISGNASSITGSITESQVTGLVADLGLKAPLASPALTGVPTAPTATVGTNTQQIATTAFVLANAGGGVTVGGSVSGGTASCVLYVGASGNLSDSTNFTYNGSTLNVEAVGTANIQQWLNASGTPVTVVDPSGNIGIGTTTPGSGLHYQSLVSHAIGPRIVLDNSAGFGEGAIDFYTIYGASPATQPPVARWHCADDGNWSANMHFETAPTGAGGPAATVKRLSVMSTGQIGINWSSSIVGQLGITVSTATNVGIAVKAATSQSANLQEWQNSTGAPLTAIGPAGGLRLVTLADASAPNGSLYLGSDHLDVNSAPKLCRKDSAGNVNVIG